MSTLEETLAAAKAAAAANTSAGLPAAQTAVDYTSPAAYTPGKMPSLRESVESSGLTVDTYFSVTPDGMRIGKTMDLFKSIVVNIDFSEIVPSQNVRGEAAGNKVLYARTTDGRVSTTGKPWAAELAYVRQHSAPEKYIEYSSYEIPFTLIDDVLDDKKNVLFKAGTTVGFTPAERNAKVFQAFFKKTPTDLEQRGPVPVKLTHDKRVGAQKYGVALFELVEGQ